ncbi:L-histidine N(alpha)-methyltransferase [Chryseobacterium arachidis]|nr:L-histidine N(alpha)-methyltransferase [Chryseobacterium arachidis]
MNLPLTDEFHHTSQNDSHQNFFNDVIKGLKSTPKHLSSKYFYNKKGDELFQKIMAMPEYYLTRCELDIFENKTEELAASIRAYNEPFDLIELGAGDALKSTYLIRHLNEMKIDFTYFPIDISGNILSVLENNLKNQLPELKIVTMEGEYMEMLKKTSAISKNRKVVLFLGSNIGNMSTHDAGKFCKELYEILNPGDILLIGFDLKKDPHIILKAYNDPSGITAAFNLNLLSRINEELEADFTIDQFRHYETYDPLSGACHSFLVSLADQKVKIGEEKIFFSENEVIEMEISQKFSKEDIKDLAEKSGFTVKAEIEDSKKWFIDSVWQVNKTNK